MKKDLIEILFGEFVYIHDVSYKKRLDYAEKTAEKIIKYFKLKKKYDR